jgi:hypothetical protein
MPVSAPEPVAGERADLLQSLARQRRFLRYTTRGLTGEQAAQQTTASELSLGLSHPMTAEIKLPTRASAVPQLFIQDTVVRLRSCL